MPRESGQPSVSEWLNGLKGGDADAAQRIWQRFFERLVKQAELRLRNSPPGPVDAEDIAVSVFESLWRGAQSGRFDNVRSRDELWWLLLALTQRKVASHFRKETAQKRGGQTVRASLGGDGVANSTFEQLVSAEPPPDYCIALEDEYARLLGLLRDQKLRQIAVLRLEGYSSDEICQILDLAPATITRKLRLIRATWARETRL